MLSSRKVITIAACFLVLQLVTLDTVSAAPLFGWLGKNKDKKTEKADPNDSVAIKGKTASKEAKVNPEAADDFLDTYATPHINKDYDGDNVEDPLYTDVPNDHRFLQHHRELWGSIVRQAILEVTPDVPGKNSMSVGQLLEAFPNAGNHPKVVRAAMKYAEDEEIMPQGESEDDDGEEEEEEREEAASREQYADGDDADDEEADQVTEREDDGDDDDDENVDDDGDDDEDLDDTIDVNPEGKNIAQLKDQLEDIRNGQSKLKKQYKRIVDTTYNGNSKGEKLFESSKKEAFAANKQHKINALRDEFLTGVDLQVLLEQRAKRISDEKAATAAAAAKAKGDAKQEKKVDAKNGASNKKGDDKKIATDDKEAQDVESE